jgi:hypothetical protein
MNRQTSPVEDSFCCTDSVSGPRSRGRGEPHETIFGRNCDPEKHRPEPGCSFDLNLRKVLLSRTRLGLPNVLDGLTESLIRFLAEEFEYRFEDLIQRYRGRQKTIRKTCLTGTKQVD